MLPYTIFKKIKILDEKSDTVMPQSSNSLEINTVSTVRIDSSPNQPVDNIPTSMILANKTIKFQTKWYQEFTWLHYIAEKDVVFCFTCITATNRCLFSKSTKTEPAFTINGFRNWKKATERFKVHQNGQHHKEATTKILAEKTTTSLMEWLPQPLHPFNKTEQL